MPLIKYTSVRCVYIFARLPQWSSIGISLAANISELVMNKHNLHSTCILSSWSLTFRLGPGSCYWTAKGAIIWILRGDYGYFFYPAFLFLVKSKPVFFCWHLCSFLYILKMTSKIIVHFIFLSSTVLIFFPDLWYSVFFI